MNQREREKTKLCHWSWSFACISPNNDRPDLKKVEGGHENKFRERIVWSKLGSGLEKLVCTSPLRIPRCTKTLLLKIIKPIYFEKLLWEESKIQTYRWYGKSVTNKCFVQMALQRQKSILWSVWVSNSRPWRYQHRALPTELTDHWALHHTKYARAWHAPCSYSCKEDNEVI